jgi:hypothetical protein
MHVRDLQLVRLRALVLADGVTACPIHELDAAIVFGMLAFSVCWWTPSVTGYLGLDVFVAAILSPFGPTVRRSTCSCLTAGRQCSSSRAGRVVLVSWTAVFGAIHRVRAKRRFSERTTGGALS